MVGCEESQLSATSDERITSRNFVCAVVIVIYRGCKLVRQSVVVTSYKIPINPIIKQNPVSSL
jgi:hypothetical protein